MAASGIRMPMISDCSCARRWCCRRYTGRRPCIGDASAQSRPRSPMSDALPILTQRRIEAAFAKGVYDEMKAELGEATAKRILAGAVIKRAKQTAAEMARAAPEGEPSLES